MPASASLMSSLASLPEEKRRQVLERAELTEREAEALRWDWRFRGRPKQLPPEGRWFVWLLLAGRGFGKTRAGAGWIHERAMNGDEGRWIALVAETPGDARDDMIEGPGGILRNTPPWERPDYEPSKRRLTWPTGAYATVYSGAHPEQLRGFSGDTAWCDEFAAWKYPKQAWNNLLYGVRESDPKICVTTTPKPITPLKTLVEKDWCATVRGSSYENRDNLAEEWFESVIQDMEGTRQGRQEIHAEILDDAPGALWKRKWLEESRDTRAPKDVAKQLFRVVVAVDPAGSTSDEASETGIVVCGIDERTPAHGYTLDDRSDRMSPNEWGREAVAAYRHFDADAIVGEVNYGGDMVEHVISTVDPNVPYREVRATRGKKVRAQPVASLYESDPPRVHHVGTFEELEDQMCTWDPESSEASPDRLDALVWAYHELMLGERHTKTFEIHEGGLQI